MGCDIHLYKEKKVNGKWVTADEGWCDKYGDGVEDVPWEMRFTARNYNLFGFLAKGVRCDYEYSFVPRGIPLNPCHEVKVLCEYYGSGGHSHSYLYLSELKESVEFLSTKTITIQGMKDKEGLRALKHSIDSDEETDWDLIYPYCQWSNSPDYEDFIIDVPASYELMLINDIITSFDGIDGENHRIVFWFDN